MDLPSLTRGLRKMAGPLAATVVLVAGGALVAYKVSVAMRVGPGWDTYAFLANAAEFAGKGFGYTELHRPPFLSWLTSLLFRSGVPLGEASIQWVDGALSLSGLLAFYFLARRRLEPVFAAAGALALLAVTPLWAYLGVGYTDTAAIALSAWTLLALTAATEKSAWWYLLAGPMFVLAVLTRFTALLIVFPALVWLLMRWSPFKHALRVAGAAILAVITYVPAAIFYQHRFADSFFPFVIALGFSEEVSAPGGEGGTAGQAAFYARNVARLLGPEDFAIVTILLLLIGAVGLVRGVGVHFEGSRVPVSRWARAVLGLSIAAGAQLAGGMFLRQVSIPLAIIIVFRALGPRDEPAVPGLHGRTSAATVLDATMLAWLLAYLDFHGHQTIQVPRYFITMAPGVIYFVMRGWSIVTSQLADVFRTIAGDVDLAEDTRPIQRPNPSVLVPLVATVCVAVLLFGTVRATPHVQDKYVAAAKDSASWLIGHDPGSREATIYSDVWPLTAWYMRTSVRPMPSFEQIPAFGHELDKSGADYFFTLRARRFTDFAEVHDSGSIVVLERSGPPEQERPRVAYLGKSWDNYLEGLTGYDFYLMSSAGRYGWEGSAFLDVYSASELARSDAVAVYGVRWKSRADGERALEEYLRDGGSVVFDASRNLDGLAYRIADTIVFDTVIRRGKLPEGTQELPIRVSDDFGAEYPDVASPGTGGPFVDEGGGAWTGAIYEARPGTPELETIAWLGNQPLVQVREVGEGRVYFVGYNFVWHAFYSGNRYEADLVDAVFADAISRSSGGTR